MYFFFFLSFSNPLFSQEDGSDFRFLQIDVTRLLVLLVLLGIAHWIRGIQFEAESPATARHVNEAGHQRLVAIRWIIRDGILLIRFKDDGQRDSCFPNQTSFRREGDLLVGPALLAGTVLGRRLAHRFGQFIGQRPDMAVLLVQVLPGGRVMMTGLFNGDDVPLKGW